VVSELLSLYGPKIFQLALRYVKNREDAEEVVQEVLMKVYRKVEAFRADSALSSWTYRITFNTAMSRLRAGGGIGRSHSQQQRGDRQGERQGESPPTCLPVTLRNHVDTS